MDVELAGRLGGLGEAVKNLDDNLRAMRAAQERMEARAEKRAEDADESRRRLYAKVDDIQDKVAGLDKKVDVELHEVRDRLDDVERTAVSAKEAGDDYRRLVQQGKGALLVFGFGGTAFGAGAIYFFDGVIRWLKTKLGL
ncbi:MAG: hypothetical protein WCY29_05850 [Novosphingobium sp.]